MIKSGTGNLKGIFEGQLVIQTLKTQNYSLKQIWFKAQLLTLINLVVQCIFDLSMFYIRKFFDLRKNFTVPKILVHKMFDLRKISRTPFFDLRKKNQAFGGKKGNFWQKLLKLKLFFFLTTKKSVSIWIVGRPI